MSVSIEIIPQKNPSCFSRTNGASSAFSSESPPTLLFGKDRYQLSQLLWAIAAEANNRRLPLLAAYDPYLPQRLTDVSVEGIGSFTLSLRDLTLEGGLIDCTYSIPPESHSVCVQIQDLAESQRALAKEIASVGKILSDAQALLTVQGRNLVDLSAIQAKVKRIVKKLPVSQRDVEFCAVQSYQDGKRVLRFPFGSEVEILGLSSRYNLSAIFLEALSQELSLQNRSAVLLTSAFTQATVGIWLPQWKVCYLTDAPRELRAKEIALSRFLIAFTAEARKGYRRLSDSYDAIEEHLCRRLEEYRALALKEETLLNTLHNESRLQSFRKRLLIDLFCSNGSNSVTKRGER